MVAGKSMTDWRDRVNSAPRYQRKRYPVRSDTQDSRSNHYDPSKQSSPAYNKPSSRQRQQLPRTQSSSDLKEQTDRLRLRSRRLTTCLICLVGAISCLTPLMVSTHATQRVGLMLLETDLIQFRSSLAALIICSSSFLIIYFGQNISKRLLSRQFILSSKTTQRFCKFFICITALTSAIAYLSITLIVPPVKQIQRMPLATFDCNANQISIENCLQRFSTTGGKQSVSGAIQLMFLGALDGDSERLIRKLNCFNFNNGQLNRLKVPTRFLLHNCGLVCRPQRQQLYQFNDDLNRDQIPSTLNGRYKGNHKVIVVDEQNSQQHRTGTMLNAPYADNTIPMNGSPSINNNPQQDQAYEAPEEQYSGQVSLKVCFWGEFSGGSSYKQFCITNMAGENNRSNLFQNSAQRLGHALSVGQMNAILKRYTSSIDESDDNIEPKVDEEDASTVSVKNQAQSGLNLLSDNSKYDSVKDQSTSYVNPIVQFESHFKDWPLLSRPGSDLSAGEFRLHNDNWCRFRPIPPFIVNNKPFNDIQCSIEHEYTMTTGSTSLGPHSQLSSDRIYLKKQSLNEAAAGTARDAASASRERCSIQCKVNLLYRVHVNGETKKPSNDKTDRLKDGFGHEPNTANFYLPLKPCSFVLGEGNKLKTSSYYLTSRIIGDTSLIITVILFDILLLIESIDTKKFCLENRRVRLIGILLMAAVMPPLATGMLELGAFLFPIQNQESEQDGYLIKIINQHVLPSLTDMLDSLLSTSRTIRNRPTDTNHTSQDSSQVESQGYTSPLTQDRISKTPIAIDYFIIPFFLYAIFMCMLSILTFRLPVVAKIETTFVRIASTEMLNMKRKDHLKTQTGSHDLDSSNTDQTIRSSGQILKGSPVFRNYHIGLFIALVWFMGIQFWLIQLCQIQIMIDIFGPTNRFAAASSPAVAGAILALVIATLFRDEILTFMSDLSPFTIEIDVSNRKVEFDKYLSVATLTYALRFFILANLNPFSSFSKPLVILFQIGEILNFPLVWFIISKRAYEVLIVEEESIIPRGQTDIPTNHNSSSTLNNLILMQSTISIVYFLIGRSSAIFLHTLIASLYLHDDNVDWFIKSFYGEQLISEAKTNDKLYEAKIANYSRDNDEHFHLRQLPPLFSPLPDEYQTYLHTSRLFIKYNSLICMIIGLLLATNFIYGKYRLWRTQEKTRLAMERERLTKLNKSEDLTEEQLTLDLRRLQESFDRDTRNYPDSVESFDDKDDRTTGGKQSRARVLFRYDTKIPESDTDHEQVLHIPRYPSRQHVKIRDPSPTREELSPPPQQQEQTEEDTESGDGMTSDRKIAAPLATEEYEIDDLGFEPVDEDNDYYQTKDSYRGKPATKEQVREYSRVMNKRVRIVETNVGKNYDNNTLDR